MLTKKESVWVIITIIIFIFILGISYKSDKIIFDYNIPVIISPILIVLISVFSKKIAGNFFSVKIEHKILEFQRFGFYEKSKFKKPIPIGLIFPFFFVIFSLGIIKILAFLQFDAENIPEKRILKKRGRVRKEEINESDLALTSAAGFYSLLLLAIIGGLFKIPELTKYSIYYGLWNLIPFGNLDGTKLFFGSVINWILLIIFYMIALLLLFFV